MLIGTFFFANPVNAAQSYVSTAYAHVSISPGPGETSSNDFVNQTSLQVYFISGVKQFTFVAFSFSDFPQDATPISATLKLECIAVSPACYISAYAGSNADWVGKNITWETMPSGTFIGANYVNTMGEYYSYSSDSLNSIVSAACLSKGSVSIGLKTGIQSNDADGIIIFYPNATLEVTYLTNTPNHTTTINPTATPQLGSTLTVNPTSNSIQNVGSITLDSTNILILIIAIGFVVILSVSIYKNRTAKKQ